MLSTKRIAALVFLALLAIAIAVTVVCVLRTYPADVPVVYSSAATDTTPLVIRGLRAYQREVSSPQGHMVVTCMPSKPSSRPSPIPKTLMQTFKSRDVTEGQYNAINSLRNENWDHDYVFFDNSDCVAFLKDHCPPSVLQAFNLIKPGAFKADIFRLAWLYHVGGTYIDASMTSTVGGLSLSDIETHIKASLGLRDQQIDHVFFRDCNTAGGGLYNAFMMCKPGSQLVKFMLDKVVERVLAKYFPRKYDLYGRLSITGPLALKEFYNEYFGRAAGADLPLGMNQAAENVYMGRFHKPRVANIARSYLVVEGRRVCKTKYRGWKSDRKRSSSKHYSAFTSSSIYN